VSEPLWGTITIPGSGWPPRVGIPPGSCCFVGLLVWERGGGSRLCGLSLGLLAGQVRCARILVQVVAGGGYPATGFPVGPVPVSGTEGLLHREGTSSMFLGPRGWVGALPVHCAAPGAWVAGECPATVFTVGRCPCSIPQTTGAGCLDLVAGRRSAGYRFLGRCLLLGRRRMADYRFLGRCPLFPPGFLRTSFANLPDWLLLSTVPGGGCGWTATGDLGSHRLLRRPSLAGYSCPRRWAVPPSLDGPTTLVHGTWWLGVVVLGVGPFPSAMGERLARGRWLLAPSLPSWLPRGGCTTTVGFGGDHPVLIDREHAVSTSYYCLAVRDGGWGPCASTRLGRL
jgi:hypothetical protein